MTNDNVEDLIALARRHSLSEPETRRLQMVLKTSRSARTLHEVGVSFDEAPTSRPGDDELLARVTARVKGSLPAKPAFNGRKRPQRRLLATLALLATGAVAAAGVFAVNQLAPGEHPRQAPTTGPGSGATSPGQEQPSARTAAPPTLAKAAPSKRAPGDIEAEFAVEPVNSSGAKTDSSSASGRRAQRPAPVQTAQALFKAGNAARKSGKPASALATYRQLQQVFAGSPEARLSYVLSGQLLLATGKAQAALPQFDTYLRSGAPGGLAEEALWGKAQALSRLGRASEERQVWRTLLKQFPKSVYAATARQRLER